VIYPSPERKIALKCDRCLYMEKPVCVDVCPTGALEVVDLEEIEKLLREKRLAAAEATGGVPVGSLLLLDQGRSVKS
jgi:Fe-S-cluster-containing hydrogenase component 2